jgi:ABC-type sugar transport system permease subunit
MRTGRATPYLYLAPAAAFLLVVFAYPIASLVWQSLESPGLLGTTDHGIQNYKAVFQDELFWRSLKNNIRLFVAVPVMTIGALLVAALLFDRVRGWRFYRSVIFVPYVLAIPVIGIIFSYIFQLNGVLNDTLRGAGLDGLAKDWLGDSSLAIWSILFVIVWQQIGFGVVLFLARLMSVDESLYDAALVDRATWWQRFRHITVPQLATVIEFFVTLSLINMLSWVFNYVYVMTGGGPVRSTYVLELLVYQTGFRDGLPNLAAATAVVVLVFAAVLLSAQSLVRRRVERLEA